MKKLLTIILLGIFEAAFAASPSDKLLSALIQVESNGNDYAVGDNGHAIGCLQIWPAVINDVNRFAHTTYSHDDCYDRDTSIEICKLYISHYSSPNASDEEMARIWNGGPKGNKKSATIKYWNKVKKAMKGSK